MRLGHRLQTLADMVTDQYQTVWDTCCDHGFLGAELLKRKQQGQLPNLKQLHFVDIQPDIIEQLHTKLQTFFPMSENDKCPENVGASDKTEKSESSEKPKKAEFGKNAVWHTHCQSVSDISLANCSGSQLVIIAGVGGDLVTQFIEELHQKYADLELTFLLCPVRQIPELRQRLFELKFDLLDEKLITENKRFYECLLVKTTSNAQPKSEVSTIGQKIWSINSSEQSSKERPDIADELKIKISYAKSMLSHYQSAAKNPAQTQIASRLADLYRTKLDELLSAE